MTKRAYRGISDSQANAEALARRSLPFTEAHGRSLSVAWDFQRRTPRDLREAVKAVRSAYADEVPYRLTEGPDNIGEDGTPRFSSQAEAYIFGNANRTDAGHDEKPLVSFYQTPFKAALDRMERGDETARKQAAIVRHVTLGARGPQEAAIAEGVPVWCAKLVAEDSIRAFLSRLTDVRVDLRPHLAGEPTAA